MKCINERYSERIRALTDKSGAYIDKNNVPINYWEKFTGRYGNQYGGFNDIYVNGLSEDEKTELKMYGYYTRDEFFDIQRDRYLASKNE